MGSAASLSSMVTSAPPLPSLKGSTLVTLPTSTPAIRTGDLGLRLLAVANAALSSYGLAKGLSLVNPKNAKTAISTSAISLARKGVMPGSCGWRGFLPKSAKLLHVLQVLDAEPAGHVGAAAQAREVVVGHRIASAAVDPVRVLGVHRAGDDAPGVPPGGGQRAPHPAVLAHLAVGVALGVDRGAVGRAVDAAERVAC